MALKPIVFCTASVFALSLAGVAHAQADTTAQDTAPSTDEGAEPSADTTAQDTAPSTDEGAEPSADTTAQDTAPSTDDRAEPSAEEIEVIVVTGVRASIVGALNVRKNSVQIVDAIVAEDIGKLPDNNVVEALQRLTGIQVTDRADGEVSTVTIRGLPDALTTLNGRKIFTAAGRYFVLQDVSANLVKQVDVYKTRSADQIETGLAGQVDVKTRRPLDFDGLTVSGLARGIYQEQANSYNPNVALLVSDRWEYGLGDIGLLVNGSWSRTKYRNMSTTAGAMVPFATENPPVGSGFIPLERIFPGDNDINWTPGLDYGLPTEPGSTLSINGVDVPYYLSRDASFSSDLYGERDRPSFNAALQWSPATSSSVYTGEVFYAGFRGHTFNSLQFSFVDWWGNPGPFEIYDGTNIVKSRTVDDIYGFNSGDYASNETDSLVYALNGQWDLGDRGKITGDVAYQTSINRTSFIAMRTERVADEITVDFNAGDGVQSYHYGDDSLLTDPNVWNVAQLYDNANRNTGDAITVLLDGYYTWDSYLRRIKAGVRYDNRKASSFTRAQDAGVLGASLATLPEKAWYTNSDFMKGKADVPRTWVLADGDWLYDNVDDVRDLYGLPTSDSLPLDRVFDVYERTMSAYVMADGEIDILDRPLRLQAGARYVRVSTRSYFFDQLQEGEVERGGNKSQRLLPSFTVRYDIMPNLRLRFNYGETLRPPEFVDINPDYVLTGDLTDVGHGSGTAGTADLEPTHSRNFDVALEWYFGRDSAIYVTGFRRDVEGLVVDLTVLEHIPNNDIVAGATDYFAITRPVNASDGVLQGMEVGLTYFPDYLGPLNGVGFTGSLTVLDSNQTIPLSDSAGNIIGETESDFFAVSDFSYNATLAYDRGPVSARLSYIWRKEFLHHNEARLFANPIGVWFKPEESLDLQLTWNVTYKIAVTFDAVNLLASKEQSYYKFDNVGDGEKFNFGTLLLARTFAVGVRGTLD